MAESNTEKAAGIADLMNIAKADNIFTNEELDLIIQFGLGGKHSTELFPASVGSNEEESALDTSVRNCSTSRIMSNPDTDWLYDKIFQVVRDGNHMFFRFKLNGIESLQFTRYDGTEQEQFYKNHVDIVQSTVDSQRKLSFTLQLTDPSEYDGGDLLFHDIANEPIVAEKHRGAISIFPSFIRHEVTPVTRGVRHSLVGWILGPSFQ